MEEDNICLRIIIEGDVQAVGYRAMVKYTARKLKIRGFVRNLPDGTVEVFCEGSKKNIETFKKLIHRKSKGGLFSIDVENAKEFPLERLPETTQTFDIEYGDEAGSSFERTNLERLEIGSLILSDFRGDTNQNLKELGSKIDGFKEKTSQNFITMENKYGNISKQMSKLTEEFVNSNKNTAELIKILIDKLDKVIK